MLSAISASMELVITDFSSEAKMVKVFFIYFYLKKSSLFFLPLTLSLHLSRLTKKKRMLLSRVNIFLHLSSFYPNQNFKWENSIIFIKTYIHMIGKNFWYKNKTLKKEKKIRRFFPRTRTYDKKENYFHLNERN